MSRLWRMLPQMFGRKAPESATRVDPAVQAVAAESQEKANTTHQLLSELRSRTESARLDRARLIYEEGMYGRRGAGS